MLSGWDMATARRMWFVPDVTVWGLASWGEINYLALEQVGATVSLLYGAADLGDEGQRVDFADLSDHRGNDLPENLECPKVIVSPRQAESAFVVGSESSDGFKIARPADSGGPVRADLLIIEMGN